MGKKQRRKVKEYNSLDVLKGLNKKTSDKEQRNIEWTSLNVEKFKRSKNTEIIFSFKFFDRTHKAFNLGGLNHVCDHWFIELLDTLKEVSSRTWAQLSVIPKFRAHPHNFDKTNFIYELFDEETLKQLDCVQFSLSKTKGRVHGFLIDNCFYIYWLDPHHNMYDSEGYPGVKKYEPEKSCFELLNEHNINLSQENQKLREKIDFIKEKIDEDKFDLLEELIQAEEKIKKLTKKLSINKEKVNI